MGAESKRVARSCVVRGRVQGVAFRYYTQERASELGLRGWVRNLPGGEVEAWIEGPPDRVEAMLNWLRVGPPSAEVRGLRPEDVPPAGFDTFQIRF